MPFVGVLKRNKIHTCLHPPIMPWDENGQVWRCDDCLREWFIEEQRSYIGETARFWVEVTIQEVVYSNAESR